MNSKKKILVVDDRETWLHTISHILGRDYHLSLSRNVEQAKSSFNEESFDLLILDKNLGGDSGLDLFKDLRRPVSAR